MLSYFVVIDLAIMPLVLLGSLWLCKTALILAKLSLIRAFHQLVSGRCAEDDKMASHRMRLCKAGFLCSEV